MENFKILKMLILGMFTLFAFQSAAQFQVNGTVRDNVGEPLPGVTILVQGTTQGVVTDMVGQYNISVPNAQSVLVYSFVGMESQEIDVNGRSVINVDLVPSSIGVDEVVVTALGISRQRKTLGYAVSEVEGEEL